MKISVVIPNYNGRHLLKENLPKVIKECQKSTANCQEIIVVDDGSTDDSIEYLKKLKTRTKSLKLKIIKNKKNLGFTSTVNRGVKEAKGEIVALLNTDVYPERGFLKAVLPHFADQKVFAVGMIDKSIENGKIVRRGRGIGEWRRGFYVHRKGEVDKTNTSWVAGGSGIFRKSIFLILNGFDEIYNPFYWEDIDLSYRALIAGYKIIFEPKSIVVHEHAKGAIRGQYSKKDIKVISYRNQFIFVWKNANLSQWLSHLFWLPYHFAKAVFRKDYYFILGFLKAVLRLIQVLYR